MSNYTFNQSKELIGILGGRGPNTNMDKDSFTWCQSNDTHDVISLTNINQYPDWKPKHFTAIHNGQPYTDVNMIISRICNNIFKYALENGYSKVWRLDDDVTHILKYEPYTQENLMNKDPLKYIKNDFKMPSIEHAYGGMNGTNFKKTKMLSGKKYSHQCPAGCHYYDLEKIINANGGEMLWYEEKELIWEDYDYIIKLRKLGIQSQLHTGYAYVVPGTQDDNVSSGTSLASSGVKKMCTYSYNLYKKWGELNTYIKIKSNLVDCHPSLNGKYTDKIVHRFRVDTLENFLEDVYNDQLNCKRSMKILRGAPLVWPGLIQDRIDAPKIDNINKFSFTN